MSECRYCEPGDCLCHLLTKALAKIDVEPITNTLPRKFDYGHPDQQRRDKQDDDYLNRFVRWQR